jgi:hypothetical protein
MIDSILDMSRSRGAQGTIEVELLASTSLDGFPSARPAPAYLMVDVAVVWSSAPSFLPVVAPALVRP